jgi:hypothetical protein
LKTGVKSVNRHPFAIDILLQVKEITDAGASRLELSSPADAREPNVES